MARPRPWQPCSRGFVDRRPLLQEVQADPDSYLAYALDAAYEDITEGRWWLMPGAAAIDDGDFYAQMKPPKRERDLSTGALRYRWSETGALDLYRHAHAFDWLASHCMRVWCSNV